jgi:hypothetical protein
MSAPDKLQWRRLDSHTWSRETEDGWVCDAYRHRTRRAWHWLVTDPAGTSTRGPVPYDEPQTAKALGWPVLQRMRARARNEAASHAG